MMAENECLRIDDLCVNYGSIRALRGISLSVNRGEIVTLIGANGAGKTTTMHAVMGALKPISGQILFKGENITKMPTRERVKRGITISPEGRQIFPRLSTLENLRLGAMDEKSETQNKRMEDVFSLFPVLKERSVQLAGTLSGGEQQMLAVGRALMGNPELLLMDEPSLGLAPILVNEIFELVRRVNSEKHIAVLLVEQNARLALRISHRAYVLETGLITDSGLSSELASSDKIKKAYLGG